MKRSSAGPVIRRIRHRAAEGFYREGGGVLAAARGKPHGFRYKTGDALRLPLRQSRNHPHSIARRLRGGDVFWQRRGGGGRVRFFQTTCKSYMTGSVCADCEIGVGWGCEPFDRGFRWAKNPGMAVRPALPPYGVFPLEPVLCRQFSMIVGRIRGTKPWHRSVRGESIRFRSCWSRRTWFRWPRRGFGSPWMVR